MKKFNIFLVMKNDSIFNIKYENFNIFLMMKIIQYLHLRSKKV
jgi:hypothetical protein